VINHSPRWPLRCGGLRRRKACGRSSPHRGSPASQWRHSLSRLRRRPCDRQAAAFIPALEWLANEILGNILTHAASETPGVVCAQYRPKQQRFDIGICDMGRGLLGSLQPAFPEVRSYGQGNGMAGSYEIVRLNGGTYQIWTGDVVYELNKGKRRPGFQSMPSVFGIGIQHQGADLAAGSGGACPENNPRKRRGTPRPRPAGAEAARTAERPDLILAASTQWAR
jgi:hypothetical protein